MSAVKDSPPKTAETRSSVFKAVFFTLLLDLLGFTLILPLFPSILDHFAALGDEQPLFSEFKRASQRFRVSLGIPDLPQQQQQPSRSWDSVLLGGLLGSLFSILQFISAPLAGSLSDYIGRLPVLTMSLIGTAVAYSVWAASASSFGAFLASRVIAGLARCSVTVCTASVSDASDTEHRGRGMLWIGLAFSLAFSTGPIIGAALAHSMRSNPAGNFAYPALLALMFALLALIVARLSLSETVQQAGRLNDSSTNTGRFYGAIRLLNPVRLFAFDAMPSAGHWERSQMRRIASVYFLFLTLFSGLEFTLPFLAHLRLGFSRGQQGVMFLFIGIVSALLQGGLVRRLKAGSERKLASLAIAALLPAGLLLGNATSYTMFYSGVLLFSMCSACPVPALTALLSQLAPLESQGQALGVLRSLGSLARAVGPLLASLAFWLYGPTMSYSIGGLAVIVPLMQLLLKVQQPSAAELKTD